MGLDEVIQDDGHPPPQQPRKQQAQGGQRGCGFTKKQMELMVKSDLQLHQRMRLLESVVLVTQTINTDNGIPIALKTEGTTCHNLTVWQPGHSFGPPGLYLILRAAIATHGILVNLRTPPS